MTKEQSVFFKNAFETLLKDKTYVSIAVNMDDKTFHGIKVNQKLSSVSEYNFGNDFGFLFLDSYGSWGPIIDNKIQIKPDEKCITINTYNGYKELLVWKFVIQDELNDDDWKNWQKLMRESWKYNQ